MQPSRHFLIASVFVCAFAGPPHALAQTFDLPPIDKIVNYQPKLPLQVFTADGVEIAQFGSERREYVPLARMPKLMQQAILSVEDSRFREHAGIDLKGMARAALAPLLGNRMHGASTITQQLVRTMLLSREFSVERKTKEILLALKVEQAISKDRILEIYMNEIYLGNRAYGFAAASQAYYGKPLEKLSVAEAAMLAGLPQNPHYANPVANLQRATRRQHTVLDRMRATNAITEAQLTQAKAEKLDIKLPGLRSLTAGHVAEMARRAVVERFGTEAYSAGIRVTTSLRSTEQRAAHDAVQRAVLAYDRRNPWRGPEAQETLPNVTGAELEKAAAAALKDHKDDDLLRLGVVVAVSAKALQVQLASGEAITVSGDGLSWVKAALAPNAKAPAKLQRGSVIRLLKGEGGAWAVSQWPQAESAFVAIDSRTGRVRALVGSFDFSKQPFNHATQAQRQPGSAFKPFLVSAALEERVMPATVVDDLPFTAANGWSPSNSNGQFAGPMSMREGLAKSSNIVSVRALQHTTPSRARQWSARFGFDADRQPDNLTLALGTGGASPLQMARAYAVFANGGWRVTPVVIEKITDAQGRTIFEAPPPEAFTDDNRAIPERNAWVMTSLLGEVTRSGTAARAQATLKRGDVYGKTGTTDDAVDNWFGGYHPSIAAVAWMGHSQPKPMGDRESGSRLALPIWIDFMQTALRGVPVQAQGDAPAGLAQLDGDWRYSEWANGNWVARISADAGVQYASPAASVPAAAASEPAPVQAPPAPSPLPIPPQ